MKSLLDPNYITLYSPNYYVNTITTTTLSYCSAKYREVAKIYCIISSAVVFTALTQALV